MNHWRDVLSMPIVAPTLRSCDLDRLDRILREAHADCADIVSHLNAGPVAICLSGGVDSSLGAAMLRSLFPSIPIVAYTIGSEPDYPDVAYAMQVAHRFGLDHRVLVPTADEYLDAWHELSAIAAQKGIERLVEGSIASYLLFRQMRRDGLRAFIHHYGADELFGGLLPHRHGLRSSELNAHSIFAFYWEGIERSHLWPLDIASNAVGLHSVFPYLQEAFVREATTIPLAQRTSVQQTKIPLRDLACTYGVPDAVIGRVKRRLYDSVPPAPMTES